MDENELALSDVQIDEADRQLVDLGPYDSYRLKCSRFFIYEQEPESKRENLTPCEKEALCIDEDGDLLVPRIVQLIPDVIIEIEHTLETTLSDVGLQVWQGCLLLCDFILDNPELFEDKTVLELGGGVGLASIVAAMNAQCVISTDVRQNILQLCDKNAEKNRSLYKKNKSGPQQNVIKVRKWDWLHTSLSTDTQEFSWNEEDLHDLKNVDVVIAADVIYDDSLTDAFFNLVQSIMRDKSMSLYIALEKRLNFTVSDLNVSCPAYTHFEECLRALSDNKPTLYGVEKIEVPINQHFQYARTNLLELWKITSSGPTGCHRQEVHVATTS